MKRCPECYEVYESGERFCEVDGQRLLADPALHPSVAEPPSAPNPTTSVQQSWLTGLLGLAVGILLCAAAYTVHSLWTADANPDDQQTSYSARTQNAVQAQNPAPARRVEAEPAANEQESPEEANEEASPEAQPQPSVSETQTVGARLNQGPVSTGQRAKDNEKTGSKVQTVILMKDGTSVEVDAAWEDKQGVWYRRGGLVSFVESQLVKSITARAEPKLSSEDSAP
jgi:cytoskeletal protein RodZ